MKKILMLITLTVLSNVFAQNTDSVTSTGKVMFKVDGNRGMSFSEGLFPAKMTGAVFVCLTLDCNGKILKWDIVKISIEDLSAENSLKYFNKEIIRSLDTDTPAVFIYPQYVRWIIPEIEIQLRKLTFKKYNEYEQVKANNKFILEMEFK